MGQSGTKTVAKRMASTNAPMKVTNKHFVLGNPIQGPFPDGMEKCVVGTGKTFFFVSILPKISIQHLIRMFLGYGKRILEDAGRIYNCCWILWR